MEELVLLAIVVPTGSVVELLELDELLDEEELLLDEAVVVVVGNALRERTVTGVLPPT